MKLLSLAKIDKHNRTGIITPAIDPEIVLPRTNINC